MRRKRRESKIKRRRLQSIVICDEMITFSEFLPCSHHSSCWMRHVKFKLNIKTLK